MSGNGLAASAYSKATALETALEAVSVAADPFQPVRLYGGTNIGLNMWFHHTAAYFDTLLAAIAPTHCHVKLEVHCGVTTATGYTVAPFDTDFTTLKMVIEKAQALGIVIDMLMIYMEDTVNYADPINPTGDNVASFFASHQAAALSVAALCDTYNIPILGLVNECSYLTNSTNTTYWATEAAAIRAVYPDLLLTAASTTWNAEVRKLINYKKVGTDNLWNYLDFLGINTYPALTDTALADVTTLDLLSGLFGIEFTDTAAMAASIVDLIADCYATFDKPVMLLEIGCTPKALGLYDPLNMNAETQASADSSHAQYLYLKTVYDVLGAYDFVAGIYIWDSFDDFTPFYWLDNSELVPYITDYYGGVFNA